MTSTVDTPVRSIAAKNELTHSARNTSQKSLPLFENGPGAAGGVRPSSGAFLRIETGSNWSAWWRSRWVRGCFSPERSAELSDSSEGRRRWCMLERMLARFIVGLACSCE